MMRGTVEINIDGRVLRVEAGISVASALLNATISSFRSSRDGTVRAPLCGMGVCQECRVAIDGIAHQRACMITVAEGMHVITAAGSAS